MCHVQLQLQLKLQGGASNCSAAWCAPRQAGMRPRCGAAAPPAPGPAHCFTFLNLPYAPQTLVGHGIALTARTTATLHPFAPQTLTDHVTALTGQSTTMLHPFALCPADAGGSRHRQRHTM